MAIKYHIASWRTFRSPKAHEYATRARVDAAGAELWRQIHGMLAGEGLLDRPVAQRLATEFEEAVLTLEKWKYYRSIKFRLRDEFGPYVQFTIIREDR